MHQEPPPADGPNSGQVVYIYSKEFVEECSRIPKVENRADMVHELISSTGLLKNLHVVSPVPATECRLRTFHTEEFVEFLKKINYYSDEELQDAVQEGEEFGLGYDCPLVPRLYELASHIVGGTLTAADKLIDGTCKVAINWCGGWHHASRDEASGFCYVNDPVIGILRLREHFQRVLYVDLDFHHGDGVLDAFGYVARVFCVSFHKFSNLFFPGTGSIKDIGQGRGKYHTVNVPLEDGINDAQYAKIVKSVLNLIKVAYNPDAVVCQFGVDSLAGDPLGTFNVTLKGLGACLRFLLSWNLPILLLGGGGYNFPNVARAWTYLTAVAVGVNIHPEIQDNKYFLQYGPNYDFNIFPQNQRSHCSDEKLKEIYNEIAGNLKKLPKLPVL